MLVLCCCVVVVVVVVVVVQLKLAEEDPYQGQQQIASYLDEAKELITESVQLYRSIGYRTHSMLGKVNPTPTQHQPNTNPTPTT